MNVIVEDLNKRKDWIDQYRGLLFYFVIVFHTFQSPLWLRHFFDFFFLPGFFLLSGLLFKRKGCVRNLLGIINGLLIPYFIFSFIISLYTAFIEKDINLLFYTFYDYFIIGGDGIWFIPCLITIEVFFTLFVNISNNKMHILLVVLVSFLTSFYFSKEEGCHLIWNVDTAIYCLFFFGVGYLGKEILVPTKRVAFLLFLFYIVLSQLIGNDLYANCGVDLHNNRIGNAFVYMVLSLIASISLLGICRYMPSFYYFKKLGQYTLFAFPFHPYFYRQIVKISGTGGGSFLFDLFIVPLITGGVLIIVSVILEKYAPYVIGKYKYLKFDLK